MPAPNHAPANRPEPPSLDDVATRNTDPLLRARDVVLVMLLQLLYLIVKTLDPAIRVPPCLALKRFLAGDTFDLPTAVEAPLRRILGSLLASFERNAEPNAEPSAEPSAERIAQRARRPTPTQTHPAPAPSPIAPLTRPRPIRSFSQKSAASSPSPTHAHFVTI